MLIADTYRPPGRSTSESGGFALLKQKVLTANVGAQPGLITTATKDIVVIVCVSQAADHDHLLVVLYEPPVSIQDNWQ